MKYDSDLIKTIVSFDMELVYAIDDEGNDFRQVNFLPTLGIFKQGEFISKNQR